MRRCLPVVLTVAVVLAACGGDGGPPGVPSVSGWYDVELATSSPPTFMRVYTAGVEESGNFSFVLGDGSSVAGIFDVPITLHD